ncbi:MAG: nucleotidyltransferase domain-containing protein [Chloroflexi bacterium]|nr:nucleotidyltransferase domain-containing protein [Chloroflexota bacterium]
MSTELNETYQKAAQEFADRAVSALGDDIDSIVLYGSVARSEAREESDIDILVVSPDEHSVRERLSRIRNDMDFESNYEFLISLVIFSRDHYIWLRNNGSPYISDIIRDGIILHDNVTFLGLPKGAARAG